MMFCPNCGKELNPNAKFCGGCGSPAPQQNPPEPAPPQAEPAPQPQAPPMSQQPVPPQQPAPKAKKSRKLALLTIPAAVIVAVILVAFNFTALAARVAPEFALSRGAGKLSAALEKQAGSGPSSILSTLFQYWKEGTFTFSGELEEPEYGDKVSLSGTLLTAKEGRELMLQDLTMTTPYERISPISFYLSGDALAVSSYDLTGDSGWYGFYLNRPLAEQNSSFQYLSPGQTESLQHQIDALSGLLDSQEDPRAAAIAGELSVVFHDFLDSAKPSVSSQTVRAANSGSVKATVLTYRFDNQDLSILAGNLFDVLLEKDNAAYLANSYLSMGSYYYIDDDDVEYWISGMQDARNGIVSYLRSDIDGDVILQFALASDGTLIQINCTGSFEDPSSGETAGFEFSLSFASQSGDMALNLKLTDSYRNTMEISLTSVTTNLGQRGGTNQTITLEYKGSYDSGNSAVLSTDWNPASKEFSTSFTVTDGGEIELLLSASGTLATGVGTMELDVKEMSFSVYDWWYSELHEVMRGSFQLNARAGSSLRMPDFKNIFDYEAVSYMF